MNRKHRFLFAAGMTGGHLFPVLSLAHSIRQKGCSVHIVSSGSLIEKKNLTQQGFDFSTLPVGRLRKGVGRVERIWTLFCLPFYILRSIKLIMSIKPDKVLGAGGALCGPVLLSARLCGCYTVIWELNAAPGLTNKILSFFANCIFISFEETAKFFPSKKCFLYSIPVREDVRKKGSRKREPDGYFHLLVLGGSQGSHSINKAVLDMYYQEKLETWKIRHQTGKKDFDAVNSIYSKGDRAVCEIFFEDMGEAYQWADVVVSRAGAGTLSELSACGKAVVLIPLASAPDDHQLKNAMELKKMPAVEVIQEKHLTGSKLFEAVMSLQGGKKRQYEKNIKKFYNDLSIQKMQQRLLSEIKKM